MNQDTKTRSAEEKAIIRGLDFDSAFHRFEPKSKSLDVETYGRARYNYRRRYNEIKVRWIGSRYQRHQR
tara:strand:- start:413 stop:619 length:207 start_codon:yes stop_codon:yes gene_type:complete